MARLPDRILSERERADPVASAMRDATEVQRELLDALKELREGGNGGGNKWTDAAWRVLVAVLTAVVIGTGAMLLQLNNAVAVQTEVLNRLDKQTVENRVEIDRLRDWRDRHVESGR